MEFLKIESEDYADLLGRIEESFRIKFSFDEIRNYQSIQQIIDLVISKLDFKEGLECSNQIAFFST